MPELYTTLNERGYQNNINKLKVGISRKNVTKKLSNPKKQNNEKPLAYVATYKPHPQNYS